LTLSWNGKRFDWVNVAWFGAIHAGALLAPWYFSWTGLALCLLLWWVAGSVGIGFTYHRLLTHRGFRVPKWLEYAGTLAGMLASEGGAISWVAMHRLHHATSDQPGKDLHTPKDGFLWSHVGWVLTKFGDDGLDYRSLHQRYAPELVADPVHRVLERLHWLPNVALAFGLYAWGGLGLVAWGVLLRLVLVLNTTWFVNSATHTWGYRRWQTKDDSRNLWWVGLLAWGEGWHNTHHAFQRSARHGFGWELDMNWLLIRALAALGLVSDIHLLPRNAERFRLRPQGEPERAAAGVAAEGEAEPAAA
jgi:fatty-acid desaturase